MKKLTKAQIRKIKRSVPRIENMFNSKGNQVKNQFKIYTPEGVFFQSYNSVVAFKSNDGRIILDERTWDYSVTTGRFRNQFLGEGIADTRLKIESGEYTLANLN